MTKSPAPRKRRPILSCELIAAEAMGLIDEGGLDALSFRALGKRLGCEAMSLYHYYPSKQHLIDALVTLCLDETAIPPADLPRRERLRQFCMNYRDTVLRHPAFAPVFTTHRLNHREGLEKLDQCIAMFESDRLDYERKATLFRVLSYYLTGAVIDEALGYAKGPGAADPVPFEEARRDFPRIMGVGAYFGKENHLKYFETGLELILDWIEAEL